MNESCCCTICSEQAAGADAPAGYPSIGAVNIKSDYEPNVIVPNMPVEPLLATDAPDIDIASLDFGPFKQVELSDKAVFDRHFMALNPQISDLTFSNLFMWRNMINFRVAWFGGFACILAIPRAYPPYLYAPVGDVAGDPAGFSGAVVQCCDFFRANGWQPRFRCVPIDVVPALTRLFKSCECEEDRDFYDYLYLASDLIELRGKKYDGKRNHIKRFTRQYEYEYVKMSPAHIDDCLRIMYDRCVENDCDCLRGVEYACDRQPSAELLLHFEALDCRGALISVDGRFEAFTVGEALNRDTAVIYIEKANTAITGIYTFINRQFAEQEWSSMTYINREEDEGVPGLRKAKLSYHPVKLIEKYTVTCK